MQEEGKREAAEAQPLYTQNCQNLSILLGREAATGRVRTCHTPACACHHLPRAQAVLDSPNRAKQGRGGGGWKVVKVSMLQQPQQNALWHPWKQPLLAASVVGLNMAVVWEEEGTAKKLVILVCL